MNLGFALRRLGLPAICRTLMMLMALLVATVGYAQSSTPTPSAEQLEILRSLPADQRDALIEQVLGNGNSKQSADRTDRKLQFPQTVRPRTRDELDRQSRNELIDGEPRLRGEDTLLLRLEVREFVGPDQPPVQALQQAVPNQQTQQQAGSPIPQQLPSTPRERIIRTEEELKRLQEFRDRVQRRNPYRLDKVGSLSVPELGPIPLAGLTVEQARQRVAVEAALADFRVDLTLLPLERVGDEALKPFGYDLFAGVPTTFAPATDIPVPVDYVVGPGDQIDVQLFGNTNKRYSLVVGRDGQVNFPELGPISVGGQRFSEVRRSLEERVASQMIGVRSSITMGDLRSIRVFVLGESERPGSYTVSGLSSITNALFASGGIKEIGSLRNIELKRNGQLVRNLDLYDLLLNGDTSGDARLLPGDVIFIPPVGKTVSITGEVRRPAIYELSGESAAADLVRLAGGLTPQADPSIAKLERINEQRQRVVLNVDLSAAEGRATSLASGDLLRVQPIRMVFENSVLVQGHVHRPGAFEYRPGMRLSDVIGSFDDLKPQADAHYVLIRREATPERAVTVLSADLAQALLSRGSATDILLAPRDRIVVFNLETGRDRIVAPLIDELRLRANAGQPLRVVEIGGRVKAPGQYPLEQGMRVSDLIRAGGSLDDAAYGGKAELTRYSIVGGEQRQTELIEIDLAAALRGEGTANVLLESYDYLNIKELPNWRNQEEIEILGEVRFPGKYPVQRGETLRSVLLRAGGLTDLAFPEGSIFLRQELKKREQQQIETLATRLQSDIAVLALQSSQQNPQAMQALTVGQSLLADLRSTKAVGRLVINLNRVLSNEGGSEQDLILRDGDQLLIPKLAQEVTVLGEVNNTTSHFYRVGLTRDDYLSLSGGPTQKADKKRIYVVRADGSVVAGNGSGWFRRSSAEIRPGDSIVVPLDAERMRPLPLWTAVTQILYNLAIAAAAVNSF